MTTRSFHDQIADAMDRERGISGAANVGAPPPGTDPSAPITLAQGLALLSTAQKQAAAADLRERIAQEMEKQLGTYVPREGAA